MHTATGPTAEQTRTRPGWDDYFLGIAAAVAARADCTRRQVGAVIVDSDTRRILSAGYNGAPPGQPGCLSDGACPRGQASYDQVPAFTSYADGAGACIAVHAEANALLWAHARVADATLYITCEPCADCRKLIAGAQIGRVVWPGGSY